MNDATNGETVRWMSYAELGQARGASAATARRMANRKRWKKQPGNDGTMRVAVPSGLAVPRETPPETSRETMSQALAALETAVMTLSRQLAVKGVALAAVEDRAKRAEAASQEAQGAAEALRRCVIT